jgi:hypothetical protein
VQNIVNDTSIPRPIRNKLFNDMQSNTGLEINPQQIFELAMRGRYGVEAGLFYFYGTHGLSFSTPLSTFILLSFFTPLYFTIAFAPSIPAVDIPPIIAAVR